MKTDTHTSDRIEEERRFHNERFTEENRQAVIGFYKTIANCFDDYYRIVAKSSTGNTVLEYGCGKGGHALSLASQSAFIRGIDISDVAVNQATSAAETRAITNASFEVMDAENMTFGEDSFDLVYGSGIIHHLDIRRAFSEIARVLKPGGKAVFVEPLGHNPLINAYRRKTPEIRTPDEHPLLKGDFEIAREYFDQVEIRLYGLATLAAIPVINKRFSNTIISTGKALDRFLLKVPGLKWWAWFTLVEFSRSSP